MCVEQNTPDQQQTIVDVICAYLRMPYTPPEDQPSAEDAPAKVRTRYENRRQELQVRLTAQRILGAHLRPEAAEAFWPSMDLDLTQAHLHSLDLTHCHVHTAQFDGAQFAGLAQFTGANFAGRAGFTGAKFAEDAMFVGAEFAGDASFAQTVFVARARFNRAQFAGNVWFEKAQFDSYAWFDSAQFGCARFDSAQFTKRPMFNEARLTSGESHVLPAGWITRAARTTEGEKEGWLYVVRVEDGGERQPDRRDSEAGTSGT